MATTSFYLLQMFPQMRTSSSVNIQYPVLDTQTRHLLLDEHSIITQYSSPNNQTKHVPSNAHFIISQHSTPSTQHPNKTSSLRRTFHHHPIFNTQQPSKTCSLGCALGIITQHSSPNNQTKHVPSDAHFASFGKLLS